MRRIAARQRPPARPTRSSSVSLSDGAAVRGRGGQDPHGGGFPRQKDLLAWLHAGALRAGDLDLQRGLANGDIELEGVAVIADLLHDARQHVLAVRALPAHVNRHVIRADQDDGPVADRQRELAARMISPLAISTVRSALEAVMTLAASRFESPRKSATNRLAGAS